MVVTLAVVQCLMVCCVRGVGGAVLSSVLCYRCRWQCLMVFFCREVWVFNGGCGYVTNQH